MPLQHFKCLSNIPLCGYVAIYLNTPLLFCIQTVPAFLLFLFCKLKGCLNRYLCSHTLMCTSDDFLSMNFQNCWIKGNACIKFV